jgi:hypothetical protein
MSGSWNTFSRRRTGNINSVFSETH